MGLHFRRSGAWGEDAVAQQTCQQASVYHGAKGGGTEILTY